MVASFAKQISWRFLCALACLGLPLAASTQESAETEDPDSIEEIVVIVDRSGNPVDIDALRIEEDVLKVIREFALEQTKQEEELWRLRLRSALENSSSRISWGYNAQREAARARYSHANYLPIDRVHPATIVSIRF